MVCTVAAAAIANSIRPNQSHSLQSFSDGALVVREGFEPGASKPTMRDLWLRALSGVVAVVRVLAFRKVARAPRRPMEVQSRLTQFRRILKESLIGRRTGKLMFD
jgi:hypothetical protein